MDTISEAERRRTFAIISHPDAGKTTLTEKLLLYAGAIHLAGSVKSRKASRHAVSDWMQMEQERGISIVSSVLQFAYRGSAVNLLDTPGHADFSEDTYRTLAAVDSAVMLIDHAKGVEARTRRLFEVCRMRMLPVVTFVNKLDRDGRNPLELMDEIASILNLKVVPMNWPIGMGRDFKGVVELRTREVTLFTAKAHGTEIVDAEKLPLEQTRERLGDSVYNQVIEDLELLGTAGDAYNTADFLAGRVSPVFWGSAMTNFGVQDLLDYMAEHAARPAARIANEDRIIEPNDKTFSGFIFKIQANMNPRHRDRIAFLRVVSGKFTRGMDVILGRTGDAIRLSKPHSFLAQERSIVEEAFPGDIVGLYDPGVLRVGDTLAEGEVLKFDGIPRFAPEFFTQIVLKDPLKRKALDTGLEQLAHEGVIQLFYRSNYQHQDPYLGAVGQMQFEVLKERLKNEYRTEVQFASAPYRLARWVGGDPAGLAFMKERRDYAVLEDRNGSPVVLVETPYVLRYAQEKVPGLELYDIEPL
ncbi:MAG: peptide chain release factor 3 [Clostridia bacterium]|nr:peptide chain release factor 3 [Deltaproteobacteria bacterium]